MISMPFAPSKCCFRVIRHLRKLDGKGKAWPSGPRMSLGWLRFSASCQGGPASRLSQNASDTKEQSAIHAQSAISIAYVASV
jgi:hypothetical protein